MKEVERVVFVVVGDVFPASGERDKEEDRHKTGRAFALS